ncbi:AMP-dependent synthetase/ligase [Pseudonocardia spinosispora]|uniref:AMP-dependent synthetase/ligase n=1 Tax=Pseudonocardia spinosispora TaxID=103441 RepID=UPI0006840F91|nr:AMP-binding protein [Pseudonocardia spinosispora]
MSHPIDKTILDAVDRNAQHHPGVTAVVDGDSLTNWSQYRRRARAIALALLDLGVERGAVVGLHMCNRAEHVLSDVGALMAGAVPASFYLTITDELLMYMARDCAVPVVVIDADQLPRWQVIWRQLPALRHLVVVGLEPGRPLPLGVLRFELLVENAEFALDRRGHEVDTIRARVRPDDLATIVYTSGTTGPPKGTLVTHAGVCSSLTELSNLAAEHLGGVIPVGWTMVSYLPLAHLGERSFAHYLAVLRAFTVTYVRDPLQLPTVLRVARPYLFLGVTRVWERVLWTIRSRALESRNPFRRMLGRAAVSVATQAGQSQLDGTPMSVTARLLLPLMDRVLFPRLRAALGLDRARFAVSGGTPMPTEVSAFFAGIGLPITEVYGMTEAPLITVSPFDAPRLGTVGKTCRGTELSLARDGEILVRGPGVTPGYLNKPSETAAAFDAAGWLLTGDIGVIDDHGYLRIVGRKKEIIVLSTGVSLSPNYIEDVIAKQSDLIGTVSVHGDGKPCLVALITLDAMSWEAWCRSRGIRVATVAEAVSNGRVRLELARAIGRANATLSRNEQIRGWTLIDELWTTFTGELTPTMKLKRPVVSERYREEIEELYDDNIIEKWGDG